MSHDCWLGWEDTMKLLEKCSCHRNKSLETIYKLKQVWRPTMQKNCHASVQWFSRSVDLVGWPGYQQSQPSLRGLPVQAHLPPGEFFWQLLLPASNPCEAHSRAGGDEEAVGEACVGCGGALSMRRFRVAFASLARLVLHAEEWPGRNPEGWTLSWSHGAKAWYLTDACCMLFCWITWQFAEGIPKFKTFIVLVRMMRLDSKDAKKVEKFKNVKLQEEIFGINWTWVGGGGAGRFRNSFWLVRPPPFFTGIVASDRRVHPASQWWLQICFGNVWSHGLSWVSWVKLSISFDSHGFRDQSCFIRKQKNFPTMTAEPGGGCLTIWSSEGKTWRKIHIWSVKGEETIKL